MQLALDLLLDYIGITICIVLGIMLSVVMFISCVCFGPVRLCGGCCGGIKKTSEQTMDKNKRMVLAAIVLLLVILIA